MSSQRRHYVPEGEAPELISKITRGQERSKVFVNVAIKPYKGKKHAEGTVVVIVG